MIAVERMWRFTARASFAHIISGIRTTLLILGVAGLLSACGKGEKLELDPALAPYVTSFEKASAVSSSPVTVTNLVAKFGNLSDALDRGQCERGGEETPAITISPSAWDSSTESEKEELMYHELGHCVLGRKHVSTIESDGNPKSVMSPYKIDGTTYAYKKSQYIVELFSSR